MKTNQLFLSALSATLAAGALFAQSTDLPGRKSNVTLSITATSEYGNFLVRDSVIEAQDSESSVQYDVESLRNPLGYEPTVNNPANYYARKETRKFRTFGSGEDALTLITENVVDEVVKLKTQKFTNANFIQELIDRGLVPISGPTGFKLVMVEAQDRMDSGNDLPILFFIENGASIHYVGRETGEATSLRDALILDFEDDIYAESYNFRERTVYKHTTSSEGVNEDTEGVTTVSETVSGTDLVDIELFPGYFDDEMLQYVTSEGVAFGFTGHLNYNGRYDAAKDTFMTSSVRVTNAPGGFEEGDFFSSEDNYISGAATLTLSVAGSQTVTDITPYLNALPEELAQLKQAFIESYSESE